MVLIEKQYFVTKGLNRIELFNEMCNLLISFCILVMGTMTSPTMKYNFGTLINYFVIAMFLVNIIFVIKSIINQKYNEKRLKREREDWLASEPTRKILREKEE